MNRREFLQEIGKSLIDTIKAAAAPLIEMSVEGIQETVDRLGDRLGGVTWVAVSAAPANSFGATELVFARERAFYLYRNRHLELRAIENRCNRCRGLLISIADAKMVKCLACGLDYDLLKEEGSLKPRPVPLKEEGGRLYLGVNTHEP